MKLIIDIPEENYKLICSDGRPFLDSYKWIKNGTPIPDNVTNGDMIKSMFPDATIFNDDDADGDLTCVTMRFDCGECLEYVDFYDHFWNAPYQKGGSDEVN